jgi:hypothetical protein
MPFSATTMYISDRVGLSASAGRGGEFLTIGGDHDDWKLPVRRSQI